MAHKKPHRQNRRGCFQTTMRVDGDRSRCPRGSKGLCRGEAESGPHKMPNFARTRVALPNGLGIPRLPSLEALLGRNPWRTGRWAHHGLARGDNESMALPRRIAHPFAGRQCLLDLSLGQQPFEIGCHFWQDSPAAQGLEHRLEHFVWPVTRFLAFRHILSRIADCRKRQRMLGAWN